jgi:hypothetical protein
MFCLENPGGQDGPSSPESAGGYLNTLGEGDIRLCMSGRCALYYCLLDLMPEDKKRVAYLPAYTCETVIAPYKKAGYTLCFYDVSPESLRPRFDRDLIPHISLLGLCGYYGFSSYDRDFVEECVNAGVIAVQDITHSAFSADGIDGRARYIAGSLRKWMGIPSGGIALKRQGRFSPSLLPAEEEHIAGRMSCFEEQRRVLAGEKGASDEGVSEIFWKTELRLRNIFDAYEGDGFSGDIITRYPYQDLIRRRRENYRYLLAQNPFNPQAVPVFPDLPGEVCPSHLALYAADRERALTVLAAYGVKATVYWPFHGEIDREDFPGAGYIYDHIYSIPIDQRYSGEEMDLAAKALESAGTDTPHTAG